MEFILIKSVAEVYMHQFRMLCNLRLYKVRSDQMNLISLLSKKKNNNWSKQYNPLCCYWIVSVVDYFLHTTHPKAFIPYLYDTIFLKTEVSEKCLSWKNQFQFPKRTKIFHFLSNVSWCVFSREMIIMFIVATPFS